MYYFQLYNIMWVLLKHKSNFLNYNRAEYIFLFFVIPQYI